MKDRNMSDTSEESVKTGIKPRNKKGFREPTSLHVDPSLWQEVRVMAVLKGVSVTEYFEDALRKKIDADNREAGKGYRVGQGGMYIPPPPQPQQQDSITRTAQNRLTKTRDEYAAMEVEKLLTGGKEAIEEQPQQEYKRNIHHYKPEDGTDKNRTQQRQQQYGEPLTPEREQQLDQQLRQWEQQRQQQPQQFKDIFKKDRAHPTRKRNENDKDISLYIPDLEFPASKEVIINYVKKADKGKIKPFIIERISNKTFKSKTDLQDDIVKSFANNKELRDFIKPYKVIDCDIITREDARHRIAFGQWTSANLYA